MLPPDVEIIMKHGSPYFQTDESVLGSLLCFLPDAPKIDELPLALLKGWWPFWRALAPAAPWVWRATKLKRRLFKK